MLFIPQEIKSKTWTQADLVFSGPEVHVISATPYYVPETEGGSFRSMAFLEWKRRGRITDEADGKGIKTKEPWNHLNPGPREGSGGAAPALHREQSFTSI